MAYLETEEDPMGDRRDAEILDILTYQHEYKAQTVAAAQASWRQRRLSPSEQVAAQQEMDARRQIEASKAAVVDNIDRRARWVWRGVKRVLPPWRRR